MILNLSKGWGITRSYLEPDIHSTVRRGPLTWVEAGETNQIIFNPQGKICLHHMIHIKGAGDDAGLAGR